LTVNPLFAFSFLESFLETLQEYLGDVTETALKDNFDIVYMVCLTATRPQEGREGHGADTQLVEEMLDEGHPMTMESAMLKEIVLPPTLMRKLLNVAGVSG
jgi:AP-3 complex subunit mu